MHIKKVLVIGKTGQLAQALIRANSETPYQMQFLDRKQCDLSQDSSHIKKALLAQEKPDLIIIAAAYTQVDNAQAEQSLAYAVNANAPEAIAQFCAQQNIALIHISTDYVFSGKASTPYQHNDETKPVNVYGTSKLSGERALLRACKHAVIVRTSWVYDGFGKNFMTAILSLAGKHKELRIVSDQFGRPTYTAHLVHSILAMTENLLENPNADKGIFHITGAGAPISWADFAEAIFKEADAYGHGPIHIEAISTEEYKTKAKRPQYSVLDTSRFEKSLGLTLPHWNEGLKEAIKEYEITLQKN